MSRIYKTAEGERLVRERYLAFLKHWPVANEQIRISTSQGETFVVASGAEGAPPLLLLHGGAGNSAMWMGDVRTFAGHFRVYAIDMIGEAGLSAASRPPLTSDAYAVWLDEVLQGLSIDRVSIVGMSLGGWLALDYATRRPERLERIAVLCPEGSDVRSLASCSRRSSYACAARGESASCGSESWGVPPLIQRLPQKHSSTS